MSEHDPQVPRSAWDSYTSEAEEALMLSASEVRRRGNQRRTRRRVGVASAALGITLLAGSTLALNTDLLGTRGLDIAGTPSPTITTTSPTPTPTTPVAPSQTPAPTIIDRGSPITVANLPTNAEIYLQAPGDVQKPYVTDGLSTASDEQTFWICENGLAEQPGVVASKSAIFTANGGVIARAHVMQLDSAARATKLADTIRGWQATCADRVTGFGDVPARADSEDTTTVDGVRVDFSTQMVKVSKDEGMFNGVLVLVSGDRVLVVAEFARGMDYNGVGPAMHQENPDLPLVNTARQLDGIIQRLKA